MSETAETEILEEKPTEVIEQAPEEATPETAATEEAPQEETDEVVIGFKGEESPPQDEELVPEKANARFAEMRIKLREAERKLREVETTPKVESAPVLGPEPDPIDFDIWDEEGKQKYKQAVSSWYAQKAKVESAQADARKQAEESQNAWRKTVDGYVAQKQALKVPDFEEAEELVKAEFSEVQQGIILQGASADAAKIVYALSKSNAKRSQLSAIKDPVKFAFELGKLSTEVTMQPKTKPKTSPEPAVKASAPSGGLQSLDTLRKKAQETGDYADYHAAKRKSTR